MQLMKFTVGRIKDGYGTIFNHIARLNDETIGFERSVVTVFGGLSKADVNSNKKVRLVYFVPSDRQPRESQVIAQP